MFMDDLKVFAFEYKCLYVQESVSERVLHASFHLLAIHLSLPQLNIFFNWRKSEAKQI